jgi:hypothetical protein
VWFGKNQRKKATTEAKPDEIPHEVFSLFALPRFEVFHSFSVAIVVFYTAFVE